MSNLKPELSTKSKYYISKHRYYELKHFCLQYNEWKDELKKLRMMVGPVHCCQNEWTDCVGDLAIYICQLERKIALVENTAREADEYLWKYLMDGVVNEDSYVYLSTVKGIPCCRDTYYDRYRKFFWLLSKKA